jgi:HAD superfamily hydrolase (TIGR01509 family)
VKAGLRAVLFDLDGVLVDSFEVWLAVVNEVALRFAAPPLTRAGLERIFGQGIEEDARTLYPGRSVPEIRAAYDAAMPRHVHLVQANPEAAPALDRLGARGIGRAIVTNTQDTLAPRILQAADLAARVDAVQGMGRGLREKPHPDLLLAALEVLGVPARDALMVGDTTYDEEAARAAGVRFVRYDVRSGASLLATLGL